MHKVNITSNYYGFYSTAECLFSPNTRDGQSLDFDQNCGLRAQESDNRYRKLPKNRTAE